MILESDIKTVEAMKKYGGGFVQALAVCFERADAENLMKLKVTFNDYWHQYLEMSKKEYDK